MESSSASSSISPSFSPSSMKLPTSSPETSLIVTSSSKFFCFLLDYSKDTNPEIIYSSDFPDDKTLFINFLSKIKISMTQSFDPIIYQHAYDKIYFTSFYFLVCDSKSPTSLRKLAIIVGNQDRSFLINAQQKFKKDILKLIQQIQHSSLEIYKKENPNENQEFLSKLNIPNNGNTSSLFTDNIRPQTLVEFINFPDLHKILQQIIDSAPRSSFLSYIQLRCELPSIGSTFKFGKFQNLYDFMSFIQSNEVNSSLIRMLDLVDSDTLFHCIFSILSGKTLVIKSSDTESATSLGRRFTLFVPFYTESYFTVAESLTVVESLKYSIAVVNNFPSEIKSAVSLLDLDSKMYKGESCPHKSFVWSELKKQSKFNEATFLTTCYREIMKVSGKFATFLSISKLNNREDAMKGLSQAGFSKDDEPIFKYWVQCASNQQNSRPILPNNRSKLGIVITAL